jgi:hypothetical protein
LQPAVCIALLASTGTVAGAGRHRFRLSETASQVSSSFVVAPKYALRGRGLRARSKKPGAVSRPGGWRSFDEYAFLEDSRYTSQEESGLIWLWRLPSGWAGRHRSRRRPLALRRWRTGI